MKRIVTTLILGFFMAGCLSLAAQSLTGRDVMLRVENRNDGQDRTASMVMTLTNKRGRTRVRTIKSISKEYGDDTKSVMLFEKPADVKGTGFLAWEYEQSDRDDDRWLYMPALRKVRRISGSSENDYFMGSDFTYDDMGDRAVDEDVHTLLGEEELDGHLCWKVRSQPVESESPYSYKELWVRQDIHMVVQVRYYDTLGLMKIFTVSDIAEIDGIWTGQLMEMKNLRENHHTSLRFSNIRYNRQLSDALFTVSTIQRGRL